jgi:hypothetical protein
MDERLCCVCRRPRSGLRRGLCRACYLRAWRGTALPEGAECAACPERRRAVLRWTQLGDERLITCHNCGFLADKMRPHPRTQEELRLRLGRERRGGGERRKNYVIDPGDPAERRREPRRVRRRQVV